MKSATKQLLVVVTAPSLTVARKLAKAALEARLVACANLIPRLESLYWWEGKLEKATEVLLLMKTTQARVDDLERFNPKAASLRHPGVRRTTGGGCDKALSRLVDQGSELS
jgi:uncharacterized protein involved in tolerance to divalent cations